MAVLHIVLIWVIVLLLTYIYQQWHIFKLGLKIPGPKGYPIIGNALLFLGKPSRVFIKMQALTTEYKRLMGLWMGPKLAVVIYDPRDAEVILRSQKLTEKAEQYRFIKPWLGESLLISKGDKFKKHKRIILPTFSSSILKSYVDIFNKGALNLVQELQKEIGKEEFDVQDYFYNNNLSSLLETTMGVNRENFGSSNIIKYGQAVADVCKIFHIRYYKVWLWIDSIFNFSKYKKIFEDALNFVHPMTEDVIQRRKQEIKCTPEPNLETGENIKRKILLDVLLQTAENGYQMSDKDIRDEVSTMMFAGQDTTSVSMGFCLSILGLRKTVQSKVYAEMEDIFGDSDRMPTYEDLQRMEYLERVIQETWRLYPPIPMIGRTAKQDIKLETCTLPAGCTIGIVIMLIHRNPDYFSDPHRFNPDNFLPENIKSRHPCSFIPFSTGFRTCVGGRYAMLNIKVAISTIIRNYQVINRRKETDWKLIAETTLKRHEGFLLSFNPRPNAPHLRKDEKDFPTKIEDIINNNDILNKDMNDNFCDKNLKNKIT